MFNFSVWKFSEVNNLDDAQKKVQSQSIREEDVEWEDEPLRIMIKESSSGENYNNIEMLCMENTEIKYILFSSLVEKLKYAKEPNRWYLPDNITLKARDERVRIIGSDILLFEKNNEVYGIVFAGVSVAKQIIIKTFPKDIWGTISIMKLEINEDILFWMFKTFIDFESKKLSNKNPIQITAIRSYLAKTRDEINTLRGKGEKISAILGTLAFLFKNDRLKSIRPELQYKGEVFLVEISLNGTFKTDENEYDGVFLGINKGSKRSAIVIYLATILLPKLVEAYNENIKSNEWSKELKIDFIKRLGVMIKESVDAELEDMKNSGDASTSFLKKVESNESNIDDEIDEIDDEIDEIEEEV